MLTHWSLLASKVLVWMVTLQPVTTPGLNPAWVASYPETALEIADEAEENPLPVGDGAAVFTASLLTTWALRESHFRRDALGDAGTSVGLLQVSNAWPDTSVHGALKLFHESFHICSSHPLDERAAWYAAGGVGCTKRLELSRSRMHAAARLAKSSSVR
jgi:hypothetical protein